MIRLIIFLNLAICIGISYGQSDSSKNCKSELLKCNKILSVYSDSYQEKVLNVTMQKTYCKNMEKSENCHRKYVDDKTCDFSESQIAHFKTTMNSIKQSYNNLCSEEKICLMEFYLKGKSCTEKLKALNISTPDAAMEISPVAEQESKILNIYAMSLGNITVSTDKCFEVEDVIQCFDDAVGDCEHNSLKKISAELESLSKKKDTTCGASAIISGFLTILFTVTVSRVW